MEFTTGNIFESNAEALVNTVNTVGVMGKGIALQFKERYTDNYVQYVAACKRGEVNIGKMFITATNSMVNPKWIINFPTKQHWMHKSSYEFINAGLDDLVIQLKERNIKSLAIPPLGAGQGGLDWQKVKAILIKKLSGLDIEIIIYEPVAQWQTANQNPEVSRLTKPRALVLSLINRYRQLGYEISLLEIQKLAYFLQRMGQTDLKLNYKQFHYGPYAHNLQHLLHQLENGYLITNKSILDSKPLDVVFLNIEQIDNIQAFIEKECNQTEKLRLKQVEQLINGYESPFGLELLSTVDWIIKENRDTTLEPQLIKEKIKKWSERKDSSFSLDHIKSSVNKLETFGKELYYAYFKT
jgi:O-acetyl-ADP-ribose deacetylase (regulator of RNase III)